jgi:AraC-like DNA-binding protein
MEVAGGGCSMSWTLSEFLNMLDLSGRTWCIVEIRSSGGFSIPPSDGAFYYGVLKGSCRIAGIEDAPLELQAGDACIILSGEAHAVRTEPTCDVKILHFLRDGIEVDSPPTITIGRGRTTARILCGRLKASWAELPRASLPSVVKFHPAPERIETLESFSSGGGASALLTRLAALTLTITLRNHPQCSLLFHLSTSQDPIQHAQQLIKSDLSAEWSVALLAKKVGMSRTAFAARFRAETGRSPMEVVTEQRMLYAVDLLQHGKSKIAEISARTGYSSEASFSRRFTRFFGLPPGQMRQMARQDGRRRGASAKRPTGRLAASVSA